MTGNAAIPYTGLDRQYSSIRDEVLPVIDQVLSSGEVVNGRWTLEFEYTIAQYVNRRYAVAVNSGAQALILAIRTLDHFNRDSCDKILLPAQGSPTLLNAIIESGYDPIFCDVDPRSGLIDVTKISIGPDEVAAVIACNISGNIVDYNSLQSWASFFNKHRIPIIEDASQSFGGSLNGVVSGSFGDISCLSFDPDKNFPNYGTGGMILTNEYDFYDICLDWRDNGRQSNHLLSGVDSKLSESDCAVMLVKLKYFEAWQARRRLIARYYIEQLAGFVKIPSISEGVNHSWCEFVIQSFDRDRIMRLVESQGISLRVPYAIPLHLLDIVRWPKHADLSNAEDFSRTCLSLPIYPELTDLEVERIVNAIRSTAH